MPEVVIERRTLGRTGLDVSALGLGGIKFGGVSEEVAPIVGTDKLVRSYCEGGASVTYRREEIPVDPPKELITTHGVIAISGSPGAFARIKERLSGNTPMVTGCDIQTVPSTLVEPGVPEVIGPSFIEPLESLLRGEPIGAVR